MSTKQFLMKRRGAYLEVGLCSYFFGRIMVVDGWYVREGEKHIERILDPMIYFTGWRGLTHRSKVFNSMLDNCSD